MLAAWEFKLRSAVTWDPCKLLVCGRNYFVSYSQFSLLPCLPQRVLSGTMRSCVWNGLKTGKTILTQLVVHQMEKQNLVASVPVMDCSSCIPLCGAPLNNGHNQLTGYLEGAELDGVAWLFHIHSKKTSVTLVASTLVPLNKATRNKIRFGSSLPYLYIESPTDLYLPQRNAFYYRMI